MSKVRLAATTAGVVVASIAVLLTTESAAYAGRSGPNAFYFLGTCTGLGNVTLVNSAAAAANNAVQVVGSSAVIVLPSNGAPGLAELAASAGTTCTITAAGFDGDIQQLPTPFTFPVLIR